MVLYSWHFSFILSPTALHAWALEALQPPWLHCRGSMPTQSPDCVASVLSRQESLCISSILARSCGPKVLSASSHFFASCSRFSASEVRVPICPASGVTATPGSPSSSAARICPEGGFFPSKGAPLALEANSLGQLP